MGQRGQGRSSLTFTFMQGSKKIPSQPRCEGLVVTVSLC